MIENHIFKPFTIETPIILNKKEKKLKLLEEKLGNLTLNTIKDSDESDETDFSFKLENQFNNINLETVNKLKRNNFNTYTPIPDTRNWYPRPTPPDLQFEESSNRTYTTYDGKSQYEWNI